MNTLSALVPLASGFEEIEAVTVIDILRRADLRVVTASLVEGPIQASRKTLHLADVTLNEVIKEDFDLVVLPGGQPGTNNLKSDPRVRDMVTQHFKKEKWIAAICAAPIVLHNLGLLRGKKATSHPSVREIMTDLHYSEEKVVVDGRIVTSRGAGTAMEFSLKLAELLCGEKKSQEISRSILFP
jgi:protein deglycase